VRSYRDGGREFSSVQPVRSERRTPLWRLVGLRQPRETRSKTFTVVSGSRSCIRVDQVLNAFIVDVSSTTTSSLSCCSRANNSEQTTISRQQQPTYDVSHETSSSLFRAITIAVRLFLITLPRHAHRRQSRGIKGPYALSAITGRIQSLRCHFDTRVLGCGQYGAVFTDIVCQSNSTISVLR